MGLPAKIPSPRRYLSMPTTPLISISVRPLSTSSTTRPQARLTKASPHRLSSVPGVLEGWRQVGGSKRHLMEMYSMPIGGGVAGPAPYGVMGKWTWQAPRSGPVDVVVMEKPVLVEVVDWLKGFNTVEEDGMGQDGEDPLLIAIEDIEDRCFGAGEIKTALREVVVNFVEEITKSVELGLCREDEVVYFSRRLFTVLKSVGGGKKVIPVAERLLTDLIVGVCTAVQKSKVANAGDYQANVWDGMLEMAKQVDWSISRLEAMDAVMRVIPDEVVKTHSDDVPMIIDKLALAWDNTECKDKQALPLGDMTERAARILGRFPLEVTGPLLVSRLDKWYKPGNFTRTRRSRLAFASMVAQMTDARQDNLLEIIGILFQQANGKVYLQDTQLCNLFLHQWSSRGYLERKEFIYSGFYSKLSTVGPGETLARFMALICTYQASRKRIPALMTMCKFLDQQGRREDLVESLVVLLSKGNEIHPRVFAMLATASGSAEMAARLYQLATKHINQITGGYNGIAAVWSWRMWSKYRDELIGGSMLTGTQILDVFEVRGDRKSGRTMVHEYGTFVQDTLLAMVREQRFTVRQRLHFMDRGLALLRARQFVVRKDFATAIIQLAIHDLHLGHLGRTLRLQWARRIALQYLGLDGLWRLERYVEQARRHWVYHFGKYSKRRSPGQVQYEVTWRMRKRWRRCIFSRRSRVAIEYARGFWQRPVRKAESWVLMKNHLKDMSRRLRVGNHIEDGVKSNSAGLQDLIQN